MNIFAKRIVRPNLAQLIQKGQLSTDPYPYTTELYKKNFIKYPTQSKQAILHDQLYIGDERLPSLEERLKDFKDPSELESTQIGKQWDLPNLKKVRKELDARIEENKKSKQLEIDSKELKIEVPVEEVDRQIKALSGLRNVVMSAQHYGLYKDLFANDVFRPVVDLKVNYQGKRVYYGNKIQAKDTLNAPEVNFEDILKINENRKEKLYHTLAFVNLDGNFNNSNNEVLLWFKSNIQNGDFKTGQENISYLQPFPMRGTGWHRCAFVLFEHKNEINFQIDSENSTQNSKFNERNFKFLNFYKKYSNDVVPIGLSFYQSEWDLSVKKVFHDYFDLKEPVYEFNFESKFLPRFEKYPKNPQPFNWYLQEYTDKKELNEHVVKDYMKLVDPFRPHPEPAKYPLIDLKRNGPRWYKFEMENLRKRSQQFKQIPFEYFSPTIKIQQQIQNLPYQQKE
ncbi:unnamed protein product [Brachionus calyciflorus]|uniref:39S ribosomal protein L38, mitochondrial n=1 Tax=Brachionus calyciflorus TaxID=104777 RepID=A0A813PF19_9BILA|nr:unnamed protein product [Brachionus calyciflorus]